MHAFGLVYHSICVHLSTVRAFRFANPVGCDPRLFLVLLSMWRLFSQPIKTKPNSRIMGMMYGLVLWFAAAQLAMADRKSSRMARMVGTKASNSIASRSGRTVSIRTGDSSSSSMPTMNHLHWVYAIASHHPKYFDQDVEIVDDAIQDLVTNLITDDDWGYSIAEVPCQENSSALGYLKCSAFAYFFDSTANLDPLGPALVDLISDMSDQYRGQFSVTWDLLPETPNAADYTYDIVVLDYQGDDDNISNKTMFDAWSLVDDEIDLEFNRLMLT
jgi:hypothetical protein